MTTLVNAPGQALEGLAQAGVAQPTGGDRPFVLDDPGAVWLLLAGTVEVFDARRAGGAHCERQHLFTAHAGELLWGLPSTAEEPAPELLAVAPPDALVRRVCARTLLALPEDEWLLPLECWVTRLWSALARGLRPERHTRLRVAAKLMLAPRSSACAEERPLWVELRRGQARLENAPGQPMLACETTLPLAGRAALVAVEESELRIEDTRTRARAGHLAQDLAAFHAFVRRVLDTTRARRAVEEAARLEARGAYERAAVERARTGLTSLLDRRRRAQASSADPAFEACRLVCAAQGVRLEPRGNPRAEGTSSEVAELVEGARLRARRVRLRPGFERLALGPLLVRRVTDGAWLALLPRAHGGYDLHDPGTGRRARLDRAGAVDVSANAWSFYRRLPAEPLTASALVHFGLQGHWRELATVALLGLGAGLLGLALPLATGVVFDIVIPGAQRVQLAYLMLGLVVSALATACFDVTRSLWLLRLEGTAGTTVQAAVWDRLVDLPVEFFRRFTAGDLAERAFGIDTIRHDLSASLVTMVMASLFGSVNLVLLLLLDLQLALWASGLLLVATAVALVAGWRLLRVQATQTELQGRLAGLVLQFVRGIAKLRAAGAEARAWAQWAELFRAQRALALVARAPLQVFGAVYPVVATLVVYWSVFERRPGALSTGTFVAFLAAFNGLLLGLLQSVGALLAIVHVVPTFERLRPVLATRPEIDDGQADPGELDGELELAHVSFQYAPGAPPVLSDVSLRVRPGEFVALVGPSGSGKSTLMRLLLGFERPTHGHVYYSGQDLAHLDLRRLRRQIGVVLQNSQLLAGDVASNVRGATNAPHEDVLEALRLAGFERDLAALPMGLHTVVSEGASTLSGGQRQRLLIARALLRRPRVVFFDEATSALDNESQAHVRDALARLEATRLVVAHRLSTIADADRIVVLDQGRIVQTGTYAELVHAPGLFAQLVRRQLL
jgi:NHLM bacteriocin system ABC transporter ATP-binding protein